MNNGAVVMYGKDHETINGTYVKTLAGTTIACGITVGTTQKPNEDCLGVSVLGTDRVLAIADGHWGREASEIAIGKAMALLSATKRPPKDNETRARLYMLFEQVNVQLFDLAIAEPGALTPETTLVVCYFRETSLGRRLYWSSFGDSYLFSVRNGIMQQLNSLNPYWLGALSRLAENSQTKSITLQYKSGESRYVGVATGLESGIEIVETGDAIFLCTDGLIGSDKPDEDVPNEIREVVVGKLPLETKVQRLLEMALARGEKDNISCVLAQVP